jgi:hypothetical protein
MGRNKYTTPPLRMGRKSNTEILVVRSGYWLYVQKKLDTPNAHMYNRSLSWFGKNGTSIKSGGV